MEVWKNNCNTAADSTISFPLFRLFPFRLCSKQLLLTQNHPQNFCTTWPSVSFAFWQYSSLKLPPPPSSSEITHIRFLVGGARSRRWLEQLSGVYTAGTGMFCKTRAAAPERPRRPRGAAGEQRAPHSSPRRARPRPWLLLRRLRSIPPRSSARWACIGYLFSSFFFSSGRSFYGILLPTNSW